MTSHLVCEAICDLESSDAPTQQTTVSTKPTSTYKPLLLVQRLADRLRRLRNPALPRPLLAASLSTERLLLRPHHLGDTDAWFDLQADPEVRRFLNWPDRDRRASQAHLARRTRHTRLAREDDFLALAVVLEGTLIGDVSLHLRSPQDGYPSVEIGWVFDSQHRGKGYAAEAAEELIRHAGEQLGVQRVIARVHPCNERSLQLAHRLGFLERSRVEGTVHLERSLTLGVDPGSVPPGSPA